MKFGLLRSERLLHPQDISVTISKKEAKCHFQQCFSYIVAVSFISGENRSTRRKRPT